MRKEAGANEWRLPWPEPSVANDETSHWQATADACIDGDPGTAYQLNVCVLATVLLDLKSTRRQTPLQRMLTVQHTAVLLCTFVSESFKQFAQCWRYIRCACTIDD